MSYEPGLPIEPGCEVLLINLPRGNEGIYRAHAVEPWKPDFKTTERFIWRVDVILTWYEKNPHGNPRKTHLLPLCPERCMIRIDGGEVQDNEQSRALDRPKIRSLQQA